jgi:hypothetical protein
MNLQIDMENPRFVKIITHTFNFKILLHHKLGKKEINGDESRTRKGRTVRIEGANLQGRRSLRGAT